MGEGELETGAPLIQPVEESTILGSRRAAWIELLFFLGVALAVDYFLLAGDRFLSVSPHPFWIIVLLLAVQYGTGEGVLAAALSSIALLAGNLPVQTIDQDFYDWFFEVSRRPLFWLMAAVILGELSQRHIRARKTLTASLGEAEERADGLSRAFEELNLHKRALEVRLAGQLRTVISTYQAAKAIEKLEPGLVLFGVSDMVSAMLNPGKFSLYTFSGGARLQAGIQRGWKPDDAYQRLFDPESPLFKALVDERRTLCVANPKDEPILEGQGVLAGPLVSGDGHLLGMLKIEEMGFMGLNLSTVENFKVVCEWIGSVYTTAKRFKQSRSNNLFSEDGGLFSPAFFTWQAEFLTRLGTRMGFPASLLELEIQTGESWSEDSRKRYHELVGEVVKKALRTTDLAFEHEGKGWRYTLILPNTSAANAGIAADKMETALDETLEREGLERVKHAVTVKALVEAPAPADDDGA